MASTDSSQILAASVFVKRGLRYLFFMNERSQDFTLLRASGLRNLSPSSLGLELTCALPQAKTAFKAGLGCPLGLEP